MANKHMERFSTSYVLRELQITKRYHYTPIRWPTQKLTPSFGKDVEQQELPDTAEVTQMVQPLCKTVSKFFTKPKILLPHDPAIVLLVILPKGGTKTTATQKSAPKCTFIQS